MIAAEYYSMGAGTDLAPLLKGLADDLCHSPHWGYVLEGEITVTYKNGDEKSRPAAACSTGPRATR